MSDQQFNAREKYLEALAKKQEVSNRGKSSARSNPKSKGKEAPKVAKRIFKHKSAGG